jgi:hypothetical protein
MASLRIATIPSRTIWAGLLALVLALRLLTPAGFMPAFEHGSVAIVVCPDADPAPASSMPMHHHGDRKTLHQPCPYAAAAALGTFGADAPLLTANLTVGPVLLLGRTFLFLEKSRSHERPPLRGPPLPA